MKKTIKILFTIACFVIINSNNVYGQCTGQVNELMAGMFLNFNGNNLETQTKTLTFSPSNCIMNINFNGVPSWATITRVSSHTLQIVCQVNTTAGARSSGINFLYFRFWLYFRSY